MAGAGKHRAGLLAVGLMKDIDIDIDIDIEPKLHKNKGGNLEYIYSK